MARYRSLIARDQSKGTRSVSRFTESIKQAQTHIPWSKVQCTNNSCSLGGMGQTARLWRGSTWGRFSSSNSITVPQRDCGGGYTNLLMLKLHKTLYLLPRWSSGKESTCQWRRGFDPQAGKIPWSRKWQPSPVFLPGFSHGQRSLAGYSPWGHKESDTTEHAGMHCACKWEKSEWIKSAEDTSVSFLVLILYSGSVWCYLFGEPGEGDLGSLCTIFSISNG